MLLSVVRTLNDASPAGIGDQRLKSRPRQSRIALLRHAGNKPCLSVHWRLKPEPLEE